MPAIILTDADGMAALDGQPSPDLVILKLTRREIDRGTVGDVVDRLLTLSDTRERTLDYAGKLVLEFEGYDSDRRELFEIPEVCRFMRAITDQWSSWLHFLSAHSETHQFGLLYALLCDVKVHRQHGRIGTEFVSTAQVVATMGHISRGVAALYTLHGLSPGQCASTIDRAHALAFGRSR
jgi:hypothetical protein